MGKNDYPITPAIRFLREKKIAFEPRLYQYEEHGGTRHSAEALGVDEHRVIKTLVMEDENRRPLIVLMHGDCEVSTKQLARSLGVKRIAPCEPAMAQKHTGYVVGGTSPFGTRSKLPVFVESTILQLPHILINAGKRGFLMEIDPLALRSVLGAVEVQVAIQDSNDR